MATETANSFKAYLGTAAAEITSTLERVLSDWEQAVARQSGGSLTELTDLLTQGVSGGKMLRGGLVRLGYELTGAAATPEISGPAAAFEILHTALLIQDDVMDKSPLRRGRPTAYQALGGDHYGISQAMCLGDMGFFIATKLIADSQFDSGVKTQVLARFSQIVIDTVVGQMLDVKLSRPEAPKREADVLRIHDLKAAIYTVVGPLSIGAILGGAGPQVLDAIERYGEHIGLAFQIQDDILGIFSDADVIGKSATSDIEENKNTLLIAYALDHATPAQAEILHASYGQGKVTPQQSEQVKRVFEDCGALAHSRELASGHVARGIAVIPEITLDPTIQSLLKEFAEFTLSRST